ncbi:MAG: DNA gyrase inhibitor YacG, partial [Burkholderiales bacterium]
ATSEGASGKQTVVTCPQCGASVVWEPANKYRPFCSERCKMIDLGAWATESYRIPIEEDKDAPDEEREG